MSPSDPLDPARARELAGLPESRLREELDALVEEGAAAAPLLHALAEEGSAKSVRKLARAALHRLRAAGASVDAPARADRAQDSVLRPLPPEESEPAHLSAPDPTGYRVGMLALRTSGAGYVYHVAFSDAEGVLALEVLQGRWRDAREALRGIARSSEAGLLVPVAAGDVAELVRRAELGRSGAPPPEVSSEELAELVRHAGGTTPGERARQTLSARVAGLSVVDAQATLDLRLDSGLAVPWVFGGEEFEVFARELLSIERSPLVLSASQQRERESERIEKFAESFFGERRRKCLSERLEETGAAWLARADEDAACAALRIALHLREARQPLEISLVRRSFDVSLEQRRSAARDDEASKLIVPA